MSSDLGGWSGCRQYLSASSPFQTSPSPLGSPMHSETRSRARLCREGSAPAAQTPSETSERDAVDGHAAPAASAPHAPATRAAVGAPPRLSRFLLRARSPSPSTPTPLEQESPGAAQPSSASYVLLPSPTPRREAGVGARVPARPKGGLPLPVRRGRAPCSPPHPPLSSGRWDFSPYYSAVSGRALADHRAAQRRRRSSPGYATDAPRDRRSYSAPMPADDVARIVFSDRYQRSTSRDRRAGAADIGRARDAPHRRREGTAATASLSATPGSGSKSSRHTARERRSLAPLTRSSPRRRSQSSRSPSSARKESECEEEGSEEEGAARQRTRAPSTARGSPADRRRARAAAQLAAALSADQLDEVIPLFLAELQRCREEDGRAGEAYTTARASAMAAAEKVKDAQGRLRAVMESLRLTERANRTLSRLVADVAAEESRHRRLQQLLEDAEDRRVALHTQQRRVVRSEVNTAVACATAAAGEGEPHGVVATLLSERSTTLSRLDRTLERLERERSRVLQDLRARARERQDSVKLWPTERDGGTVGSDSGLPTASLPNSPRTAPLTPPADQTAVSSSSPETAAAAAAAPQLARLASRLAGMREKLNAVRGANESMAADTRVKQARAAALLAELRLRRVADGYSMGSLEKYMLQSAAAARRPGDDSSPLTDRERAGATAVLESSVDNEAVFLTEGNI